MKVYGKRGPGFLQGGGEFWGGGEEMETFLAQKRGASAYFSEENKAVNIFLPLKKGIGKIFSFSEFKHYLVESYV